MERGLVCLILLERAMDGAEAMLSAWGGCPNLPPNGPAQGKPVASQGGSASQRGGTHGARWSRSTLAAPAQRGRASPPVPPEWDPSLPAWLPGCSQDSPVVSLAVCYGELSKLPPSSRFPWISARPGRALLERTKPEAVMNTALSTWSLFPHEGGERTEQRKPLL